MAAGQQVLSRTLDVAALNRVEASLADGEAVRGAGHARQLRDVLALHRLHAAAGLELNTVPQAALVLSCSEHRAAQLLDDALLLSPLHGAIEALECGLLTVEQSRKLVDALEPLPFAQRLASGTGCGRGSPTATPSLPPARLNELLRLWVIQADPAGADRTPQAGRSRRLGGLPAARRRPERPAPARRERPASPSCAGQHPPARRPVQRRRHPHRRQAPPRRRPRPALRPDPPAPSTTTSPARLRLPPAQPAPCGADITVLVPLGAALGTTDEPAELVGHGPLEPDLLQQLLRAAPVLRAVFVDEHGVPVADSPRVERPPRNDPAAVRDALLRLAASPPGPHQPRHPDDHPPPRPATRRPPDALTAALSTDQPVVLSRPHPTGTPGSYRVPARLRRFLSVRSPRCEWPGCGARAVCCDLDHDPAWPPDRPAPATSARSADATTGSSRPAGPSSAPATPPCAGPAPPAGPGPAPPSTSPCSRAVRPMPPIVTAELAVRRRPLAPRPRQPPLGRPRSPRAPRRPTSNPTTSTPSRPATPAGPPTSTTPTPGSTCANRRTPELTGRAPRRLHPPERSGSTRRQTAPLQDWARHEVDASAGPARRVAAGASPSAPGHSPARVLRMAADDVQLPDLEVIQRYSLAVRGATAPRADVIAALQADLAWLTERRRPAAPAPARRRPRRRRRPPRREARRAPTPAKRRAAQGRRAAEARPADARPAAHRRAEA